MADEVVILEEGGFRVTNKRFIIGNQTFALRNVTSVGKLSYREGRGEAIAVFVIVGLALVLFIAIRWWPAILLALALVAYAAVHYRPKQKTYHLAIQTTSARHFQVISSTDEQLINRVVAALNEAIIQIE